MGEQYRPFVADPFMEIDISLGGLGLEIGCDATKSQARLFLGWRSEKSAERGEP